MWRRGLINLVQARVVVTATAATAITSPSWAGFSTTASESGPDANRRPVIAVVGARGPAFDRVPSALKSRVDFVPVGDDPKEDAVQSNKLKEAVGLLWIPRTGAPSAGTPSEALQELWPRLPKCTWVHSFAAGVETLMPFAQKVVVPAKGAVAFTNGRGAFSASLAEHALAGMLYFNKDIPRCQANRRDKKWDSFVMDTMGDKTVGLLGAGSIGLSTGKAAKGAFGCRVVALRRKANSEGLGDGVVERVYGQDEKEAFFKECDFVVCSLPSTPQTKGFVGANELRAMKPSSVFISLGRGAVVDEAALANALATHAIKGAVLDVFAVEPLPQTSPLWDLDNVLLTAHNADLTANYFELGWNVWAENLERFLEGDSSLATPVDVANGY